MNTTIKIKGDWDEVKSKLKSEFPKLTDSDLGSAVATGETMSQGIEKDLITDFPNVLIKKN